MSDNKPNQPPGKSAGEQLIQVCQKALAKLSEFIPALKAGNQQFIDACNEGDKVERRVIKSQELPSPTSPQPTPVFQEAELNAKKNHSATSGGGGKT